MAETIRFKSGNAAGFTRELNRRVNEYFRNKGISKNANTEMVIKTVFMFLLYIIPYTLVLSNILPLWGFFMMWFSIGLGTAGIGFSIMHDANHGAYSKNPRVNKVLGYSINLVGGNATNWKIQHNVLHHTYTNIVDHDEDISPRGLFRFTPHTKRKGVHRYQYLYAWFFYSLMTFSWILVKDYVQLVTYTREGLLRKLGQNPLRSWSWLIFAKLFYFGILFGLPLLLTNYTFFQLLIGFAIMHLVAGFFLAIVFQTAHVVDSVEFPIVDESGEIQEEWSVHQLKTTANFAPGSRILGFFIGGLNFQVEHHLFPNICHVHYKRISPIVKQTAEEFGLPYNSYKNFVIALYHHAKLLKMMGRAV